MNNELRVFGRLYGEFKGRPRMNQDFIQVHFNDLKTKKEVLTWYLEMNSGGTPHSRKELRRVSDMLRDLEKGEKMIDFKAGDICRYSFDNGNKSDCTVEIVRILNNPRGIAEVKFLAVRVDDSGNGYFSYLLKTGKTMNVSFEYLTNRVCRKPTDLSVG